MITQESMKNHIIRLQKRVISPDWFAFNQGYTPLLSKEATILFMNLFSQSEINSQLDIDSCDFNKFIRNYGLTEKEFISCLDELSRLQLIKITRKTNAKQETEIFIQLQKIKSLDKLLIDKSFGKMLKQKLPKEKYLELVLMLEDENDISYELDSFEEQPAVEEKTVDKDIFRDFYDGVTQLLKAEFTMCPEVLDTLHQYQTTLDVTKLQQIAWLSTIKAQNGKYMISPKHFSFLTEQEATCPKINSDLDKHKKFWGSLNVADDEIINKQFKELFRQGNPFMVYAALTGRNWVPGTLKGWIKNCVQKGFSFPLISALMSFVTALIGKISVNYLIKVSDTLVNDYAGNREGLIELVRNVIESDLNSGKNRLNASRQVKKGTVENKNNSMDDFVWYYNVHT
ncbi:hypothetical protein MHSWG343_01700 [Candidatus Mycoplasma haematohominis]|uniref:Replicative helicase loading/DNA remodeling protein DnaB N-terminal winged helix domain-containing protein n=1 Tax=Candidatus Mycoplasma haematohominis TaxID=1494318 RepID=A0A478FPP9_9MOLU|nr:hypothetical protein MHSWG343_01700 [Candidatus Mycoplasma haemohominis]